MRGKVAKKLRREAYGDKSSTRKRHAVVGGKKIPNRDDIVIGGTLVCIDERVDYKDRKKEHVCGSND